MKTKLSMAFYFLCLVFFVYLIGNVFCIFFVKHEKTYLILGIAASVIMSFGAAFCCKFKKHELTNKNLKIIFLFLMLAMLALQMYMIFALKNPQNTDAWAVNTAAQNFAVDGNWDNLYRGLGKRVHYFDRYTNNWAILLILSGFYRIVYMVFGSIKIEFAMIFNAFMIQLSYLILYLIAKTIFKSNYKVLACLVAMFACLPLYTYTTVVYTDTFGMPFVMASVYFIIKLAKSDTVKNKIIYTSASALTVALGYSVKGSIAVIIVAGIIYLFLTCNCKKAFMSALAFLSVFFIFNNVMMPSLVKSCGIVSDESLNKYRFPATHWVMMGLNGEGKFYDGARRYTVSFPDYESKKEANIKEIKKTFSKPKGELLNHFNKKAGFTWADGSFRTRFYIKNAPKSQLKTVIMNKKSLVNSYVQIYHVAMLIFMLTSIITAIIIKDKSYMLLIRLIVFGLSVFLMIWETNPRYLFSFVPLMLVMAADGVFNISHILNIKLEYRKSEMHN